MIFFLILKKLFLYWWKCLMSFFNILWGNSIRRYSITAGEYTKPFVNPYDKYFRGNGNPLTKQLIHALFAEWLTSTKFPRGFCTLELLLKGIGLILETFARGSPHKILRDNKLCNTVPLKYCTINELKPTSRGQFKIPVLQSLFILKIFIWAYTF